MEAEINGARLFYEEYGEGEQTLLILHGWGCTHETLDFAARFFSQKMRVITLDFPGHGQSGEPPSPWGVSDYAQMVHGLLQQCGVTACDVMAHSFGGRVALVLGSDYPHMIRSMILTGAAGIRKPPTREGQRRAARYRRLRCLAERIGKLPGLCRPMEQWMEKLRKKYGSKDYNALTPSMRQTFVKVVNEDLVDRLPTITAPTLLLWGTEDTETPIWMGRTMEEKMPDAALIPFEGCGHFAFLQQPERFITISKQFLLGGN